MTRHQGGPVSRLVRDTFQPQETFRFGNQFPRRRLLASKQGDRFRYWHGAPEGDESPHFRGLFNDSGRLMALLCHNNDIGDGWECEGEDKEYFEEFSEKFSYPYGINLVTYVMTL